MEEGDIIIDGGNEWYENTERRQVELAKKGIVEIGMGVSGGEEGARRGKQSHLSVFIVLVFKSYKKLCISLRVYMHVNHLRCQITCSYLVYLDFLSLL